MQSVLSERRGIYAVRLALELAYTTIDITVLQQKFYKILLGKQSGNKGHQNIQSANISPVKEVLECELAAEDAFAATPPKAES